MNHDLTRIWRTLPLPGKLGVLLLAVIGGYYVLPMLFALGQLVLIYLLLAAIPILALVGLYFIIFRWRRL